MQHQGLLNSRHNFDIFHGFSVFSGEIRKACILVRIEVGAAIHCHLDYISVFEGHIVGGCAHSLPHKRIFVIDEIYEVFIVTPELSEVHARCAAAYGHSVAAQSEGFSAEVVFLNGADEQVQHSGLLEHGSVFSYLIFGKAVFGKVEPINLHGNHGHKRFAAVLSDNIASVLGNRDVNGLFALFAGGRMGGRPVSIEGCVLGEHSFLRNLGSAVHFGEPAVKAVIPAVRIRNNGKRSVRRSINAFGFAASAIRIKCNRKAVCFPAEYREAAVFVRNILCEELAVGFAVKLGNKGAAFHFGFTSHNGAVCLKYRRKRSHVEAAAFYHDVIIAAEASHCAAAANSLADFSGAVTTEGHGGYINIARNTSHIICAGYGSSVVTGEHFRIVLLLAHYTADPLCGFAAHGAGIFAVANISVGVCSGYAAHLLCSLYRSAV